MVNWEMESGSPSASESSVPSVSTLPVKPTFSRVLGVSFATTGASFTALTAMASVAVAVAPPLSLTM